MAAGAVTEATAQSVSAAPKIQRHDKVSVKDASKVASKECVDTTWTTWTCPFGWPVQGVWSESAAATAEVRACHRSPSGRYVATGDSAGRLNPYHHPAPKGAQGVEGTGHSSHVMNVRFSAASDECLVTCGGNDRCVLRWGISKD